MNKNTKIAAMITVVVVVAVIAFFGGVTYGKSKRTFPGNIAGMNQSGSWQQRDQQGDAQGVRRGQGMDIAGGEIISKDEKSFTVKLQTGSTKIVFLSASTTVSKTVDASLEDLSVGTSISASGQANSDGSINATSIQIRPAGMEPKIN